MNPILKQSLVFKGDTKSTTRFETSYAEASEVLEFEKAMEYRDMIRSVEQTTEKQIIALNDYKDRDFYPLHIMMMTLLSIF